MNTKVFNALALLLVLVLAVTAELWASSLAGVALAALGLAVIWALVRGGRTNAAS